MNPRIDEQQIADFRRDGVVVIRNLLDADCRQWLADGIEYHLQHPTERSKEYARDPSGRNHFFFDACRFGQFEDYDRYMLESPLGETAARMLGSRRAILFYLTVFVRAPGTRTRTPWHQDQPSWSARGEQACSIWTSLDPVPAETALEFVRGSHRWPRRYQRPSFFHNRYEHDDRSALPEFPDIEANRDHYDTVRWAMQPGDCLVFHGMTAHGGSGDLPGGLGRRAVSVQWLGDDARIIDTGGLDDPDISRDLLAHGVGPGDAPVCAMCPIAWPRDGGEVMAAGVEYA